LNDYTAVDNDNSEVDPQSPQTINLDDSEQNNVQSNPDPCTIIDLSEESDPELQQFVSNNEPVLSLSDSHHCDTNQSHSQASTVPTQVRG